MSTRCFVMRCRSRSIGPSKTSSLTSYPPSGPPEKSICRQIYTASGRPAYSTGRPRVRRYFRLELSAVEADPLSHLDDRLLGLGAGSLRPALEEARQLGPVPHELVVPGADGSESLDQHVGEGLLEVAVAGTLEALLDLGDRGAVEERIDRQ